MALYWHFRNKDEMLAGLAERIWSEIDTDIDPTAGWPEQLRGLLDSLVRVLRSHPCASQLLVAGDISPVARAFGKEPQDHVIDLPDVMSRKKQVAPKLLQTL